MSQERVIIQMGSGTDMTGDATRAALHAARNALQTASLRVFDSLGLDPATAALRLTIAVPDPGTVDEAVLRDALADEMPAEFNLDLRPGGLSVEDDLGGPDHVTAAAALETFLPRPGQP